MKKLFLITLLVLSVGCQFAEEETDPTPDPDPQPALSGLKSFSDCQELTQSLAALEEPERDYEVTTVPTDDGADSAGAEEATQEAPENNTTVEEADLVKRVGNRLYIISGQGKLFVYDVSQPSEPQKLADISLSLSPYELYADGFRVMVIGRYYENGGDVWEDATTRIVLLDLTDAEQPITLKQLNFENGYVDSRKVGPSVYLVLKEYISFNAWTDWVDQQTACDSIYIPKDMDGWDAYSLNVWEIIGFNMDQSAVLSKSVVLGSWLSSITATPEHLYLSNLFSGSDETGIYMLNLDSTKTSVIPQAYAIVPGRIVNQFSMDETDGFFRIASTTNRSTFGADDNRNYLTIFRADDGSLSQVSQLDSITPGESITAVRFLGSRAFLTTYVTKDPLVAIDLADPTQPKIRGELDVPGYAHYLHAWGDRLISLGSTDEFWGEVVITFFDISDLDQPQLIEQITITESTNSEAQYEHKAFSFFADQQILAIPISDYCSDSYLAVYSVNAKAGFRSLGTIEHNNLVRRSLIISNSLYSISQGELKVSPLDEPEEILFSDTLTDPYTSSWYGCYPVLD